MGNDTRRSLFWVNARCAMTAAVNAQEAGQGTTEGLDAQVRVNRELWASRNLLSQYSGRTLRAPEVVVLLRYHESFSGRVLELGCGGGRLSGYLIELAQQFHGLDISPVMIDHCRQAYPAGAFEQGDLRDLSRYETDSFEVVFAPFNVLDVLDDGERRRVLAEIRRMLSSNGLLVMSSHNLAFAPRIPRPTQVISSDPIKMAKSVIRLPRRLRNWRRLLPLQRTSNDHAVLVDQAHDYSILHYYIGRDDQQRQLAQVGFELIDCFDLDGRPVRAGDLAASCPELHYVARVAATVATY
jgi:SAM-dependent methyltransferase